MDQRVIDKYNELRRDHVGLYTGTGAKYHHRATAQGALEYARFYIDVKDRWNKAEKSGIVRIRTRPDYIDFDDLCGDCFSHEANPDIQPHILDRQREEYLKQVNEDGVWVLLGEVRCPCCGNWKTQEAVGGVVGYDWEETGIAIDLMAETLAAMEDGSEDEG